MEYKVYKVEYNQKVIYIGHTGDIVKRQKQHNYSLKKGTTNFYRFLRENKIDKIELIELFSFDNKVEAKRYECYLILKDYFENNQLLNKIPNISDR